MTVKNTKGLHTEQIKMLIYASSGVGKTTLAGTITDGITVIISAESGLLCLSDKEIDVLEVKTFEQVRDAYLFVLKESNYDNIFIDSLTEISDILVSHLEKQPEFKDPKNTLKMWGEYNKKMTELIKGFRDLNKNVIFTALPDDVQDSGVITKKPLIKGTATQKLLCSYFDEVFYLAIDPITKERQIQTQPTSNIEAKDRSGKLLDYEEPNLQNIINKIKGK